MIDALRLLVAAGLAAVGLASIAPRQLLNS